jgi:hypothetical protein
MWKRISKVLGVISLLTLLITPGVAQVSPARMGINPTTAPWPLYVNDPTGRWVLLAMINQNHVALIPSYPIPAVFYGDSGSNVSDNCAVTAGSNIVTISNRVATDSGDWQVGQGFMCREGGPAFNAALNPSNLQAVQNGTTGSDTLNYTVAVTDANGAVSTPVSTTITNANAATNITNPVILTMTSPSRTLPGSIWKQRNGGTWQYLGTQIPIYTITLNNGGSGYTPGVYMWMASGGDCVYEPFGYITVDTTGAVTKVDVKPYWHGCATQDPSFVMPPAAGSGSGIVVTLSLTWQFMDGGESEQLGGNRITLPNWLPSTPPSGPLSGFYNTTITALSGNRITGNTYAQTTQSNQVLQHEETAAIMACLTTAALSGQPNPTCKLACGNHNVLGDLSLLTNFVAIEGASQTRNCVNVNKYGLGDIVSFSGANNRIADIRFTGYNQTDGWGVNGQHVNGTDLTNLFFDHTAGGYTLSFTNDIRTRHLRGQSLWGPGYSDWDKEAGGTLQSGCCFDENDVYSNDNGSWQDGKYNTTRRGHVVNGIATVIGANDADSNVEGYGVWIDDTGVTVATNQFRANVGKTQFFQQSFDSCEFSGLNCWHIDHAWRVYLTNSISHAGYATDGVDIGRSALTVSWIGGTWSGAGQSCGNIKGGDVSIIGVSIIACGGNDGSPGVGTYPGVKLGGSAQAVQLIGNHFGDLLNNWFSYPVELDAYTFTATAYTSGQSNITMQTPNDGSVLPNMDVFDSTINRYLGQVANYIGTQLNLTAAPNFNVTPGSNDVLYFSFGHNIVQGNSLFGANSNANNYINDLSYNPTNRLGMNANDQEPGWQWNNVQQVFAIGGAAYGSTTATAGNNGFMPGISARFNNPGSDVRMTLSNVTTVDGSSASQFLGTGVPGAYGGFEAQNNTYNEGGDPSLNIALGPGMGSLILQTQGGKYGSTTPINLAGPLQSLGTPGVTCSGAPTGSFASKNGLITHC